MRALLHPDWKPVSHGNTLWAVVFVFIGLLIGDRGLMTFGLIREVYIIGYLLLVNPSQGEKLVYGLAGMLLEVGTALYLAVLFHSLPLFIIGVFFAALTCIALVEIWRKRHLFREVKW